MKNKLLFLVFGLIMGTQIIFAQSWITRPNFPSTDRTAVGCFAIGSKGYYIGGETSTSTNLVDTWEYDTNSNSWTQKANYPGTGTQKGVAFTINGVGYYGLGTVGGQLYSYDSQNNLWAQKMTCNLPGVSFWSTTYFVVGNKAYFLDQNNKFFYYDSVSDSWTILSDFTGTKRTTGVGFSINNKGYICTGLNATSAGNTMLNDLWEYNTSTNLWTQKTALPDAGRYASFGFSFNNKGYVLGGETNTSAMSNQFWEYNPSTDSWTTLPNYIGGAKNYLSGFVANNSVYAGFGSPGFGISFNEYGYYNQSSSFCTSLSGSLTNGLVGFWPFCGNANDQSGNGYNGIVNGATLTTDRYGLANSAYNFDGLNNKITLPLQQNGITSYTVSAWFKTSFGGSILAGRGLLNQVGITLHLHNTTGDNGKIIYVADGPGLSIGKITNNTYNDNQWHHIVGVFNSYSGNISPTQFSIYIDNQLVNQSLTNTSSAIAPINNGTNLLIGAHQIWGSGGFFNGKLDDIGIWNRALTQQEITQLFNENQCITNITVTDTLIINVGQMSYNNPVTFANNITIYPNPASTQINISFNNITDLTGGNIHIINSLGQQVASTPITLTGTSTTMALNTWGGNGVYFVQILNAQGQIVDIKKIILQ